MLTNRSRFWWGLGLIATLTCTGHTAAGPMGDTPVATVAGAPKIKGAKFRFFESGTGSPMGSLQVAKVDFEYRRQGFMRVAWRPLVVLSQVDLMVGANVNWSEQGSQVVEALQSLGGRDELVLREVALHLAGPSALEITAASAQLTERGELELIDARVVSTGDGTAPLRAGTFRLSLSGPHAGQLRQLSNPNPGPSRLVLSPNDHFDPTDQ